MSGRRKTIISYDDLDSRREMWRLLGHPCMGDRRRTGFIRWCCLKSGDRLVSVKPAGDGGKYSVEEAMLDLSMLTMQYRLDIDVALAELVRRVKHFSKGSGKCLEI